SLQQSARMLERSRKCTSHSSYRTDFSSALRAAESRLRRRTVTSDTRHQRKPSRQVCSDICHECKEAPRNSSELLRSSAATATRHRQWSKEYTTIHRIRQSASPCQGRDSNSHGLPAKPLTVTCVYQFHHPGPGLR